MATSTELRITSKYMEHSGGTKFYEVVLLTCDSNVGMLIKRYGKLSLKKGGGQTLIERGTIGQMVDAYSLIIDQKSKRGYSDASALTDYGLHQARAATAVTAVRLARAHYSDPDVVQAIADYFGLDDDLSPALASAARTPEPEPVIDRGDEWGTF